MKWTSEEDKILVELRRSFKTVSEIALMMNKTEHSINSRLRRLISSFERIELANKIKKDRRQCDWSNPEERKKQDHQWYLDHKDEVVERANRSRQMVKNKYIEYKKKQVCKDCGNEDWRVIVFHHEEKNKEDNIADLVNKTSWDRVLEELEKCVALCSNCHIIRHYEEKDDSIN